MSETEQEMRAKGLALVAKTEEYARTHPEFVEELQAAEADIADRTAEERRDDEHRAGADNR